MSVVCYDCATDNDMDALLCHVCGSACLTQRRARPTRAVPAPEADPWLPTPWSVLERWPSGSIVVLDGGPGSGKSSLAALLRPRWWLTSEETVSQVKTALARMQQVDGDWPDAPEIVQLDGVEELHPVLEEAHAGLMVLDSITQLGGVSAQLAAFERLEAWVRTGRHPRRVLVIAGLTKDKQPAGRMELLYRAQTWCSVRLDGAGLRLFAVNKHRHGPLSSRYFALGAGGVERPAFPYAYSVEGEPGAYTLVAWPSRGTRWAGLLDAQFRGKAAQTGVASAATVVTGYPEGLQQPRDVAERRRFAEAHGLTWLEADVREAFHG